MSDHEIPHGGPTKGDIERIRIIGQRIRRKRIAEQLTLGRAAEQSGVSAATLSRLERQGTMISKDGKGMIVPDTRTLSAIRDWLGAAYSDDTEGITQQGNPRIEGMREKELGTPQIVEAYLRADRNLDTRTAGMLSEMFRLAYEQYSALSNAEKESSPESKQQSPFDDPSN